MTVENTPPARGGAVPRTVQEYIDETPMWADSGQALGGGAQEIPERRRRPG